MVYMDPEVEIAQKRQQLASAEKNRDVRTEIRLCGELGHALTLLHEFEEAWKFHLRYTEVRGIVCPIAPDSFEEYAPPDYTGPQS